MHAALQRLVQGAGGPQDDAAERPVGRPGAPGDGHF